MRNYKIIIVVLSLMMALWLTMGCGSPGQKDEDTHDHTAVGHVHSSGEEENQHEASSEVGMHQHVHVKPEIIKKWGLQHDSPQEKEYIEKILLTGIIRENKNTYFIVNIQQGGVVTAIRKDIGDTVKRGEVLCVLKSFELLNLKKDYIESYQRHLQARENYQRAQKLYKIKAIEKKEFINRETDYKTAMAGYFSLESELNIVGFNQANLADIKSALKEDNILKIKEFLSPYYYILSPSSGVILSRALSMGENIEREKAIYEVSDTRRVWAYLDALEKNLRYIDKGKSIEIVSDSYPEEVFKGKVVNISPKVDPQLRTIKIRVEVENHQGLLKPEMYVNGILEQEVKRSYLAIPESALVKLSGVDGVFIIDGDGFLFKPVVVIDVDSKAYAFVKGVDRQDMVIVKGAFYLKAEHEIQSGKTDPHAGHTH